MRNIKATADQSGPNREFLYTLHNQCPAGCTPAPRVWDSLQKLATYDRLAFLAIYREALYRLAEREGLMMSENDPAVLVLATLAEEPKRGYAITQDIANSVGVVFGPGTS